MFCVKKITDDLTFIGGSDRRINLFENVYPVPNGVSYNSYFLDDEKTVVLDTVDKSISDLFFENLEHCLNGRKLDYLVIHHMEPDHAATLADLVKKYDEVKIVCNTKTVTLINQFFTFEIENRILIVNEGSVLNTGKHELVFLMMPMVHWPETMASYDKKDKIFFSADAFGTFGSLNGHIFADEVDYDIDYMPEARRYYTNIVGKYGTQVQAILKKAANLDINMIAPLHGHVWRKNVGDFIEKYLKWSSYTPEQPGVVIPYGSVYGNTENVAMIIASKLADRGIRVEMFDVSKTHPSYIVSSAFRYSHIVFVSTTYNAGIFVNMENLVHDIAAHNLRNRTVSFVENGSWGPTSGKLMRNIIEPIPGTKVVGDLVTIKSSLKERQLEEIDALVESIVESMPVEVKNTSLLQESKVVDNNAFFKIEYGLFVLTAKENDFDNGCIINTVMQVTDSPKRISIAVNKANYTYEMIQRTGVFNLSILTEDAPFELYKQFGFISGKDGNKFSDEIKVKTSENGLLYLTENSNSFMSANVIEVIDCGTHSVFVADVTEAVVLCDIPSATYDYYFKHVKPKPQQTEEDQKGWICKICGYVHEDEELPADYICPICKHGAEDFEKL